MRCKDSKISIIYKILEVESSFCLILGVILFDFCPEGALGKDEGRRLREDLESAQAEKWIKIQFKIKQLISIKPRFPLPLGL